MDDNGTRQGGAAAGERKPDPGLWDRYRRILAASGAEKEDLDQFDRVSRRRFLTTVGKGAALGLGIFGAGPIAAERGLFGRGLLPSGWENIRDGGLPKPDMVIHSEDPFNGELPVHLLDDAVTPTARHFVRNNGGIPQRALSKDMRGWALRVDGEVDRELSLTFEDLYCLPQVTMQMVLECAGNGRSLFEPQVGGTQWIRGAVGCSEWTGVRLRDVLESAGVKEGAVYAAAYGEDAPPEGREPFSRGIPIAKAMDGHTLIAFAMNGAVAGCARIPGAAAGSRLDRQLHAEVAQPHPATGPGARLGEDERLLLPRTVAPGRSGSPAPGRGHGDRHLLDRQVAHHPAAGEPRGRRRGRRAGRRPRLGWGKPGGADPGLHRL